MGPGSSRLEQYWGVITSKLKVVWKREVEQAAENRNQNRLIEECQTRSRGTSGVTRPDTRLPKSRAGGQGLYLRSLDLLGRSSEAKVLKNPKKVKCDGPTDQRTN